MQSGNSSSAAVNPAEIPLSGSASRGVAGSASLVLALLREMGPKWALYRIRHAFDQKSGLVRLRNPPRTWEEERKRWPEAVDRNAFESALGGPQAFFFKGIPEQLRMAASAYPAATGDADAVLAGDWDYFGTSRFHVGFPPEWNRNPQTGEFAPSDRHWSLIGDRQYGDIKFVWEASRFSVVYALVRGYAVTSDEKYAEAFWQLVESWAASNPPHNGPNWRCGQEASFRIMALYFGLYAFANADCTTHSRICLLLLMVAVHAERIERNIDYALSQNNNHGVSEALGLWTVGLLSPEFRRARVWREKGRRFLERLAREQFYDDGSYVQHSVNYHRLVLHDYIWAMRLGELNGQRLSSELYAILGKAVQFLGAVADPESGHAPNYGNNDGAYVLPLNSCEYSDMRPVLQAGHFLVFRRHLFPAGPWDEDLVWLFGPDALRRNTAPPSPVSQRRTADSAGGYSILAGVHSSAMVRCARYKDRPAHADQLHVDLWWRGINIACDPGTYLYNGVTPWRNALAATEVHNTVTVDSKDQMVRCGPFLWLDWAQGKCFSRSGEADGQLSYWEGEHNGYRRVGVVHRRCILSLKNDTWVVVDDVVGTGQHIASVQWLLPDFPFRLDQRQIALETPEGVFVADLWCSSPASPSVFRAGRRVSGGRLAEHPCLEPRGIRGWFSRSYGQKQPAISVVLECEGVFPVRFCTVFHPSSVAAVLTSDEIGISGTGDCYSIPLSDIGVSPIIEAKVCTNKSA